MKTSTLVVVGGAVALGWWLSHLGWGGLGGAGPGKPGGEPVPGMLPMRLRADGAVDVWPISPDGERVGAPDTLSQADAVARAITARDGVYLTVPGNVLNVDYERLRAALVAANVKVYEKQQ